MSHADEAQRLLERLAEHDKADDPQTLAARAQAHALLAVVEAVESLIPPPEPDAPEMPPAYTKETFQW